MDLPVSPAYLVGRFGHPDVRAIVLMGSYARRSAGPFSDIDLVRFAAASADSVPGDGTHLIEDTLVVVSTLAPDEVQTWFERPECAVDKVAGARQARPLLDRDGYFAGIQRQAERFVWDAPMQARANLWASAQMVGWIEEVHKGLAGIQQNDIGRLLNARHGCSWGLSRVMQVQRGILVGGDNAFYAALADALGPASDWVRLRRIAFGIEDPAGVAPSLADQVRAGLALYCSTAQLLAAVLEPNDRPLVERAVARIHATLEPKKTHDTKEILP